MYEGVPGEGLSMKFYSLASLLSKLVLHSASHSAKREGLGFVALASQRVWE